MFRHCFQKPATLSNQIFTFTPPRPPSEVLISSEMAQMWTAGGRGSRGLESCPLTCEAPETSRTEHWDVCACAAVAGCWWEPNGEMGGQKSGAQRLCLSLKFRGQGYPTKLPVCRGKEFSQELCVPHHPSSVPLDNGFVW